MTLRALVIDDDPHIVDVISDIVASLGHTCDSAGCQDEARQQLATAQYDYFVLDLEIPVRSERSVARLQNGLNLLGSRTLATVGVRYCQNIHSGSIGHQHRPAAAVRPGITGIARVCLKRRRRPFAKLRLALYYRNRVRRTADVYASRTGTARIVGHRNRIRPGLAHRYLRAGAAARPGIG